MHENFRVWPYAHKIKHIVFVFLEWGNVLEIFGNFWNFGKKQVFLISGQYLIK